jgi:hypothetical protein
MIKTGSILNTNGVITSYEAEKQTLAPGLAIKVQNFTSSPPDTSTNYYNAGAYTVMLENGAWSQSFTNGMVREWDKKSNVKLMLHTGGGGEDWTAGAGGGERQRDRRIPHQHQPSV